MKTPDEIKKGLSELKKLRALMTFNPVTGEDIDPLFLNEENRELYEGVDVVLQHIQQLEAERDAAVEDLKYFSDCRQCNSWKTEENCRKCRPGKNWWQWRGVQKEE